MEKILKTYAVYGMMEWVCQITTGKCRITVPFSGGTLTGYGVTPALFATDKPVVQCIIENSAYFKNGKIKLYRKTATSDKTDKRSKANGDSVKNEGVMPVKEFSDYDSAKDWLADEMGVNRNSLRSQKSVIEAAAAKGYELRIN